MPGRTILVVDDDPDIRTIANLSLRNIGKFQLALVASGAEAVKAVAERRPDVVLLDVMMPELDGPSTLLRLRELPDGASLPVIFMTANSEPAECERLVSLGAVGVISKPFNPMRLPDQLRKLMQWT